MVYGRLQREFEEGGEDVKHFLLPSNSFLVLLLLLRQGIKIFPPIIQGDLSLVVKVQDIQIHDVLVAIELILIQASLHNGVVDGTIERRKSFEYFFIGSVDLGVERRIRAAIAEDYGARLPCLLDCLSEREIPYGLGLGWHEGLVARN